MAILLYNFMAPK